MNPIIWFNLTKAYKQFIKNNLNNLSVLYFSFRINLIQFYQYNNEKTVKKVKTDPKLKLVYQKKISY